VTLKSETA